MRISDWSSDVCSSDLRRVALLYRNTTTSAYLGELLLGGLDEAAKHHLHLVVEQCETGATADDIIAQILQARVSGVIVPPPLCDWDELAQALTRQDIPWVAIAPDESHGMRSEEPTSELQSLMRISYA